MVDDELDRLWERIGELFIRRENQKDGGSGSEYTFAIERARYLTGRYGDKEKIELLSRLKKAIVALEEEVNLPVVLAPSLDPASAVDVTDDARAAFGGKGTPIGNIWSLVNNSKVKWSSNSKDWTKAYVFACLSEIVYLQIGKYELKGKDRYKIIPSEILRLLLETNISLDFARVLVNVDVGVTISDTNNFLFASFIFPKFTVVAIRGTAPILQDIAIDLKEMMLLKGGEGYQMGFYNEAPYLRTLLIHGARSVVFRAKAKSDKRSLWISDKQQRLGTTKACVAVANKNARIIWSLIAREEEYRRAA